MSPGSATGTGPLSTFFCYGLPSTRGHDDDDDDDADDGAHTVHTVHCTHSTMPIHTLTVPYPYTLTHYTHTGSDSVSVQEHQEGLTGSRSVKVGPTRGLCSQYEARLAQRRVKT